MPSDSHLVCLVTGPLIGLDSHELLKATCAFGKKVGKDVAVFDVIDELAALEGRDISGGIRRFLFIRELLEGYEYQFELKRHIAYWSIRAKIDALPNMVNAIVRAPAAMEFRGVTVAFKDHRAIARALRPDRVVTLIDAEWKIRERLENRYDKRAFELIAQAPTLDLERILRWLAAEVSSSEDWAAWCAALNGSPVEHVVMGVAAPARHERAKFVPDVDNLLKAATERELPKFYASYSMTLAGP